MSKDMQPLRSKVRTFSKGLCCHCENCVVFLKGRLQEKEKIRCEAHFLNQVLN